MSSLSPKCEELRSITLYSVVRLQTPRDLVLELWVRLQCGALQVVQFRLHSVRSEGFGHLKREFEARRTASVGAKK